MPGDAGERPEPAGEDGPLWLHAVVREPLAGRARRWLGPDRDGEEREGGGPAARDPGLDGTRRVRHEGLAAVVSPAPEADGRAASQAGGGGSEDPDAELSRHARVVEALAASGAVVPAPPGLRASGEPAVRAFLERARLALEEALERFDGACEMRLHVRRHPVRRETDSAEAAELTDAETAAAAGDLYRRLRRHARAARRLPPAAGDVLTAAFLVPRAGWSEGEGIAARWRKDQPGLLARLTGPWAPYDFVRMFPDEGGDGAPRDGEGRTRSSEGGRE